ncbi:MAG: TraR/DksA family transcriptional regulator [Planctomycetia bacterium]|nr:TraR/DksA family transcriptional regulator [Planctomycetia bacterium]
MKAAELREFKASLEALRARLRGDVETMAEAALRHANGDLSTMPIHMADIGSDAFEQEFTLSLMANEEDTLEQVEQALGRIRARKFGICEDCEGVIARKRLEAIPFASVCIRCAEKRELDGGPRPRQPR